MEECGAVLGSEEADLVAARPRVHWLQDLVKVGDRGASWRLTAGNCPSVMKVARKCPLGFGVAWRHRPILVALDGYSSLAMADDVGHWIVSVAIRP